MKYREILLEQLKPLPFFNKETIYQLSKQYDIKNTTVDAYISRSLARKDFFQLKKGMYVTDDFFGKNKNDISYTFYLANVIRMPSYVSSWMALQYYNLTTEAIRTVTSVTLKVTRDYRTKAGNFAYHSIKKELFSEFHLVKGKFVFFIASPSKALFDLLYFRTSQFRGLRVKEIPNIVEELRIDLEMMGKNERATFHKIINDFIKSHE
jgi:predicted transcriptional regulator of viral defense system